MPAAQPSTTEQQITIYVQPYIRKYLLARLADPQRRLSDATSRQLFDELQARLGGRRLKAVVNDYRPEEYQPQQRVVLVVLAKPRHEKDLHLTTHQHLTGLLTKSYQREMYSWVDFYRSRLGMSTRAALNLFRAHYSISEDDHAFLTAERLYHKHCQVTGQSRRMQSVRKQRARAGEPSHRWRSPR